MCGRFTLESDPEDITLRFGLERSPDNPRPREYVSQGKLGLAIVRLTESRLPVRMSFGLPPPGGYGWTRPMLNARAETVHEKPAFRDLFRKRRCIVPATCFIENGRETGPFRFQTGTGEQMGLAGIWQTTGRDRNGKLTCAFAVITAPAGALVGPVHHRMPAILAPGDEEAWLNPASDPAELRKMLGSGEPEGMAAYAWK